MPLNVLKSLISKGLRLPPALTFARIVACAMLLISCTTTFKDNDFEEVGEASWYGPRFHGRMTANGERYNMYELTAAHPTLDFGTVVKVHSKKTGRTVTVRINDRGPYHDGRVIDLSYAAARKLGIVKLGTADVEINSVPN